jgi:hypothetical protein
MAVSQVSEKRFITVSEMAESCRISRSRFYDHLEAGVFPKPVRHPSSKRPMYDRTLQEACLEIRQTGIGANGVPVLFNCKRKPKEKRPAAAKQQSDYADLLISLKGLGLTATAQAVAEAVAVLYPTGVADVDQGDVVRKVFLYLQGRRK